MALQSETGHQKSTEPTVRSIRSDLTWPDRQSRWSDAQSSQPISKRRFDSSTWSFAHGLIPSIIPSAIKSVLQRSLGVVKWCEIDPMARSNRLNLLDPLLSDKPSSLREGFEATLQSKSHAFEEASMDYIGERMPIQNSMKIRRELHSEIGR